MALGVRSQSQDKRAPQLGGVGQRGASRLQRPSSSPSVTKPVKPQKPKSNWLGAFKHLFWGLVLVGLVVGGYVLSQNLLPYINRPIARVGVQGELPHVSPLLVQERLAPLVERPFFQVDLLSIRQELEQIPWVARAEVRRVWPDQIVVRLAEQIPIARWGQQALLNTQGQSFTPGDTGNYAHLPYLYGPQRAQQKVMHQYQILSHMLRPLGFSITRLELRDRGSWFLSTEQGIEMLLGRDQVLEKIRRFTTIYQKALESQRDNIARIDLRYPKGLAVAWREAAPAAKAATSRKN